MDVVELKQQLPDIIDTNHSLASVNDPAVIRQVAAKDPCMLHDRVPIPKGASDSERDGSERV